MILCFYFILIFLPVVFLVCVIDDAILFVLENHYTTKAVAIINYWCSCGQKFPIISEPINGRKLIAAGLIQTFC